MDAFRLTQIRTSSAAIILLAFVLLRNKSQMRATKGEVKDLIIFGIIGIAAVTSFYFFAIKYLYVSVALIIEFTAPIWIVLYLKFIKKKSVPATMWWGIAFAFSGLLLISQIWSGSSLHPLGVFVAFLDALALALYFIFSDRLSQTRTVIPYLLTVTAIRELSASTSSVIGMIEPIFAGVIAWWLLSEAFTTIQLIGCAVVLFGIYLADKARNMASKS